MLKPPLDAATLSDQHKGIASHEHHFNGRQAGLRRLASAWLLAALGAIALSLLPPAISDAREARESPSPSPSPSSITQPGDHDLSLVWQGEARRYRVHVPPTFKASQPSAVVYFFHGGGGNLEHAANEAFYGQVGESDRRGHIVVFPNGHSRLRSGKLATWNAGHCCGSARDEQVDDVGFVRALHAELQRRVRVDPTRVFAAGMSNGGMMAYRLACEASDVFSAIAAVAGTDNTRVCQPERAVSILHIHAKDDERVLFNGGAGQDSRHVTDFVSVPESTAKWARLNGCQAATRGVLDAPGARCVVHDGCRDGKQVQLCVTDTGGHAWPGGRKVRGGAGSPALSATERMGAFFFER